MLDLCNINTQNTPVHRQIRHNELKQNTQKTLTHTHTYYSTHSFQWNSVIDPIPTRLNIKQIKFYIMSKCTEIPKSHVWTFLAPSFRLKNEHIPTQPRIRWYYLQAGMMPIALISNRMMLAIKFPYYLSMTFAGKIDKFLYIFVLFSRLFLLSCFVIK